MKKLFSKIWKDPVWSNILAFSIITLITFALSTIISLIKKVSMKETILYMINYELSVKYLLILLIIALLYRIKFLLKKRKIKYSEEHKKLDRDLLLRIKNKLLPHTESIDFIRYNNFAGFAYENKNLQDFFHFVHIMDDPNFEFIHEKLNKSLENLKKLIPDFVSIISLNTWSLENNIDFHTVPPEWEYEQPERFTKVVDKIHDLTTNICSAYDILIKTGRQELGI